MADETRDDMRLENDEQQDEVEGHAKLKGAAAGEPRLEPRLANDEGDDDVEGHMKLRSEPKL